MVGGVCGGKFAGGEGGQGGGEGMSIVEHRPRWRGWARIRVGSILMTSLEVNLTLGVVGRW